MRQNMTEPGSVRSGGATERTRAPMETVNLSSEEKAAQDAKLKPEREAKFQDYIVSAL